MILILIAFVIYLFQQSLINFLALIIATLVTVTNTYFGGPATNLN